MKQGPHDRHVPARPDRLATSLERTKAAGSQQAACFLGKGDVRPGLHAA